MTAKTSQHLADELKAAGFELLAERAAMDEFHDYLSPHDMPAAVLDHALYFLINDSTLPEALREAAGHLRNRHHNGEFDASDEEGDDWAASEEGQAAFKALGEKP